MKKRLFVMLVVFAMATALLFTFPSYAATGVEEPIRYGATTISGNTKYIYDQLALGVCCDEPKTRIDLDEEKNITLDELKDALAIFRSDYPECFWLGLEYSYAQRSGNIIAINPTYSFTADALATARAEVNSAVEEIISDMPNSDNYTKALYLHDALAKRVEYEKVGEHQTVYGALASGKAVCAGYAAAYHLLLREAGIQAWTVTGDSINPANNQRIAHAWNVVWMDENTPVYTDVTWDDQDSELYHYYFNISKSEISSDHILDIDVFTLPEGEHTNESYFDKNDLTVSLSTTPSAMADMFDSTKTGVRTASVYYVDEDIADWLTSANRYGLLDELGVSSATITYKKLGQEYHITLEGSFPALTNKVLVYEVNGVSIEGKANQLVIKGEAMEEILVRADASYHFPTDYPLTSESGVDITRVSDTVLKISGTPTASVTIILDMPTCSHTEKTTDSITLPACQGGGQYEFLRCNNCAQTFDSSGEPISSFPTEHVYPDTLTSNSTHHWQQCACGEKKMYLSHTFGAWSDGAAERTRTCEICGYVEREEITPTESPVNFVTDFIKKNATVLVLAVAAIILISIIVTVIPKRKK